MVPHKNSLRSTMNPRFVVVSVLSLPSAASLLKIRFQESHNGCCSCIVLQQIAMTLHLITARQFRAVVMSRWQFKIMVNVLQCKLNVVWLSNCSGTAGPTLFTFTANNQVFLFEFMTLEPSYSRNFRVALLLVIKLIVGVCCCCSAQVLFGSSQVDG